MSPTQPASLKAIETQGLDDASALQQFGLSNSELATELEYLDIDQSMAGARGVVVPYIVILFALLALMLPFSPPAACLLWALSFSFYILARRQINRVYAAWSIEERKRRHRSWHRIMIASSSVFGGLWGSAGMIAFPGSPLEIKLLWTLAHVMLVAGAPRLLTMPQFVALLIALQALGTTPWLFWGGWLGMPMAITLILLGGLFMVMTRHYHRGLREKFELQLRNAHLARMLAQRNSTLEEISRARTLLLAAASHDLRQPVHALGLLMETLQRPVQPRTLQRRLVMANQCVDSLSEMLSNLLDFSRMDSSNFPVTQRIVLLQELLDDCGRIFAPMARHKKLALRFNHTSVFVRTDPHLTRRMLFNLISNAIKYTDRGAIEVRVVERNGQVVLQVEDSGVGIAPEHIEDIFRDYVTSDAHAVRFDMGIGLGLGIVRRCGKLLDQQVTVVSEPGIGSRFSIHMGEPVALDAAVSIGIANAEDLSGVVAVIENDPIILEGLIEMLRDWGCQPVAGPTPDLVQGLLEEKQLTPRLILSDLHLGIAGTGFEAIESLRRIAGVTHVPAVVLTGDISPVHQQRAATENVRLEHKPIRPARLREVLSGMLASA
ncbi:MAG: hybrid sensor histidine kinase/response regulator [Hydrogenophaga sp.]|uniref:ATP-binding response regulator n=1 Tax=Hydrogenophaga sp. TaxID=1904254 RepID=UPI003D0B37AE